MTARSYDDLEKRIVLAEELGFAAVGLPQIAARDAMVSLAPIARRTSRIRLGTGVVPIWTRTPVTLAQEASVLQELSGGRFLLGIGVGHPELISSWHGTEFRNPMAAMRDYLTILKQALRGDMVNHKGKVFSSTFSFIGYEPSPCPILVGALGPQMLQLAGELADGVVLWLSSAHHLKEVALPNLKIGADKAGRSLDGFEIFSCMFAAPGEDRGAARDAIRMQLLTYLQLPHYRAVAEASGFSDDVHVFQEKLQESDVPGALQGLSDSLVDELAVTGSKEEMAETIKRFVDAGCTMPGVGIAGRYDGFQGTEWALQSLKDAAATV
jgi:alkanesulfonate monooxygenase SsuD/methylene tetrahydromethanopterin reductase-like flavin-dependent oxidoreductase (luciferase family)